MQQLFLGDYRPLATIDGLLVNKRNNILFFSTHLQNSLWFIKFYPPTWQCKNAISWPIYVKTVNRFHSYKTDRITITSFQEKCKILLTTWFLNFGLLMLHRAKGTQITISECPFQLSLLPAYLPTNFPLHFSVRFWSFF